MAKFLSLKDHVYDFISDKIRSGQWLPEQRINEQTICEDLAISRTPVREALIQLAAEGYIDNQPRKGFAVKHVDQKKAAELYAIIGTLDGLAAALAMPRLTKSHLNEMNALIAAMNQAILDEAYDVYHKQQERFHNIYADLCANESLIELLAQQKRHFIHPDFSSQTHPDITNVLLATNEEHKKILEYFRNGNATGVSEYLQFTHWRDEQSIFDALVHQV